MRPQEYHVLQFRYIIRSLLAERAVLNVYDPKVKREDFFWELKVSCNITPENTPDLEKLVTFQNDSAYKACDGAHALAVLTEWDEFTSLDYAAIFGKMTRPAFAFDGRNVLNHDELRSIGFDVYAIGKPCLSEEKPMQ